MLLRFGAFELDTGRAELRGPDGAVPMEPKALALLTLLAENADRVVGRDEMIAVVWDGRVVSDAAVSTVLKLVRRALGDDGASQGYVRTVHGRGHRLVTEVRIGTPAEAVAPLPEPLAAGKPTVAVLPFRLLGDAGPLQALPEAIAAEVIASLSRLRWLRVIARESTFRFRGEGADLATLQQVLGAGYALSGVVEVLGGRLAASLELADTRRGHAVWADRFAGRLDDVHELRAAIVAAVVSAIDAGIPANEAEAARRRPSESLDAWGAFHVGLAHAYRFNGHDNALAAGLFRRATELDPDFSAAWAARSFTSYQDATMGFVKDRSLAIRLARGAAERSLELDPQEPTANFAMGRLAILDGTLEAGGAGWLDRAVELSPSFAKGHYSRALLDVLAGRHQAAREGVNRAIGLSPLDPLMGPMLGVRALALLHEDRLDEALDNALGSARLGAAHPISVMQTAAILGLRGRADEAARMARQVRERRPDATVGLYFGALPVTDPATRDLLRGAMRSLGFPD